MEQETLRKLTEKIQGAIERKYGCLAALVAELSQMQCLIATSIP